MLASAIIGLCSFALINGAQPQQQQEQQEEPVPTKIGPYTFPIGCSDWSKCVQAIGDYARGQFKEGSRELVTIDGYDEVSKDLKKAGQVSVLEGLPFVAQLADKPLTAEKVRETVRHIGFPYIYSRIGKNEAQGPLKLLSLMNGRPELTPSVSEPCTGLLKKAPMDYFLLAMASVCEDIVNVRTEHQTEGFKLTDFWGLVEAAYEKMENVEELDFQKLFDSEDNSVLAGIGKLLSEKQVFELASKMVMEAEKLIEEPIRKKLAEKYSTDNWIEKPEEVQKEDEPGDSDLIQKLKSFYEPNKVAVIGGMIAVTGVIVIAIVLISVKCC